MKLIDGSFINTTILYYSMKDQRQADYADLQSIQTNS